MESLIAKIIPVGQFTAQVVTCFVMIGLYFKLTGQFNLHEEKIDRVNEKANKANTNSKAAIKASKKAIKISEHTQKTVKKLSEKFDVREEGSRNKKNRNIISENG